MTLYHRRPEIVDAEQWWPGKEAVGVRPTESLIVYSRGREFYYIHHLPNRAREWLEVAPREGLVPEDQKTGKLDGFVEFVAWDAQPRRVGRDYHRRILPFAFWEVKSERPPEPIACDDPLYLDYAAAARWPQNDEACIEIDGREVILQPDDWILRDPATGKALAVVNKETFEADYVIGPAALGSAPTE